MGLNGEYFGDVTNALTNLTADQHEPVRDRLVPQTPAPQDLPEPEPLRRGGWAPEPTLPMIDGWLLAPLLE